MICSVLAFNYSPQIAWWRSSLATGFVLIFGWCAWRKDFRGYAGLRIDLREIFASIAVGAIVTIGAFLVVRRTCISENISMYSPNGFDWYHHFFQTLNEEIVFGAQPLFALRRTRLGTNAILISLALASAFSGGHYVFYRWLTQEKGSLELLSLAGLFLVGAIRNNLILRFNHIGFSWAVHFGFIVAMLGVPKVWRFSNTFVSEPQAFNLILGSPAIFLALLVLAFTSCYWVTLTSLFSLHYTSMNSHS